MESTFNIRPTPKMVRYTDFSYNVLAKLVQEIFRIRMSGFSIIVKRLPLLGLLLSLVYSFLI